MASQAAGTGFCQMPAGAGEGVCCAGAGTGLWTQAQPDSRLRFVARMPQRERQVPASDRPAGQRHCPPVEPLQVGACSEGTKPEPRGSPTAKPPSGSAARAGPGALSHSFALWPTMGASSAGLATSLARWRHAHHGWQDGHRSKDLLGQRVPGHRLGVSWHGKAGVHTLGITAARHVPEGGRPGCVTLSWL